jgi:hypothetical protein
MFVEQRALAGVDRPTLFEPTPDALMPVRPRAVMWALVPARFRALLTIAAARTILRPADRVRTLLSDDRTSVVLATALAGEVRIARGVLESEATPAIVGRVIARPAYISESLAPLWRFRGGFRYSWFDTRTFRLVPPARPVRLAFRTGRLRDVFWFGSQ